MGAYNLLKTARYFAGGGPKRAAAEELLEERKEQVARAQQAARLQQAAASTPAKPSLPPGKPPAGAKPLAKPPLKPAIAKPPLRLVAKAAPKKNAPSLAFSILSSAPVTAALFIIAASFFGKPAPHATAPELALIGLVFIGGFSLLPGVWEYKTGASKQLMVKGASRYKYYKVAAVGDLIAAVLFFLAGAQTLALFALSLVVITAVFALITQEWNISIHLGALSSVATAALFEFGRQSWWLFLLIVPVALMRVERKAHTYGQVAAGAILPIVITWFVFSAFGAKIS